MMSCLPQTDVVGHCKVDYQVEGVAGKSLLLKKTRDIPSCTARSSTTSFIKGVEYDFVGVRTSLDIELLHADLVTSSAFPTSLSLSPHSDFGTLSLPFTKLERFI